MQLVRELSVLLLRCPARQLIQPCPKDARSTPRARSWQADPSLISTHIRITSRTSHLALVAQLLQLHFLPARRLDIANLPQTRDQKKGMLLAHQCSSQHPEQCTTNLAQPHQFDDCLQMHVRIR
jgi:hypothetical protein